MAGFSQPKATETTESQQRLGTNKRTNMQQNMNQTLAGSSNAAKGGFEKPQLQSVEYNPYIITVLNQLQWKKMLENQQTKKEEKNIKKKKSAKKKKKTKWATVWKMRVTHLHGNRKEQYENDSWKYELKEGIEMD